MTALLAESVKYSWTLGLCTTGSVNVLFVNVADVLFITIVSLADSAGNVILRFALNAPATKVYLWLESASHNLISCSDGLLSCGLVSVLLLIVCIAVSTNTIPEESPKSILISEAGLTAPSLVRPPALIISIPLSVSCDVPALMVDPPKRLYSSVKLALIFVPAPRNVSPVLSFADVPVLIVCFAITYSLASLLYLYVIKGVMCWICTIIWVK